MIEDLVDIRAVVHLSSTAVQTAVGYVDAHSKKLKIMAIGHVNTRSFFGGSIVDSQELSQAIEASLKEATDMVSIDFRDVGLSFSTPAMASINGMSQLNLTNQHYPNPNGRKIVAGDVKRLLDDIEKYFNEKRFAAIQMNVQCMVLDDSDRMLKNAIGMTANKLTLGYHLNSVPCSYYQQMKVLFAQSGLGIHPALFSGVASAEYALYADEKERGVCFINIGAGSTNVCIYKQNILLFSHCFDFGGRTIDERIAKWLNVSLDEAECLKKEYGTTDPSGVAKSEVTTLKRYAHEGEVVFFIYELCSYIEEEYCRLMDMIFTQIRNRDERFQDYIDSGAGIVLSGGATNMNKLDTLIERRFNINVRKSSQNHTVGVCAKYLNDDNIKLVRARLKDSRFNDVIGALLYQFGDEFQKCEQLRYFNDEPDGLFHRLKLNKLKTQLSKLNKLKNWI